MIYGYVPAKPEAPKIDVVPCCQDASHEVWYVMKNKEIVEVCFSEAEARRVSTQRAKF